MSALIEFECRPCVGGYDVIAFDQRKARLAVDFSKATRKLTGQGLRIVYPPELQAQLRSVRKAKLDLRSVLLRDDATNDERYAVERWGDRMIGLAERPPEIVYMLRPRSERTKSFDLFEKGGPEVFFELAQAATEKGLKGFTEGNNEEFLAGVQNFAARYGLLENDSYSGSSLGHWWVAILEMRRAIAQWARALKTGDFSDIIRLVEKRQRYHSETRGPGVDANVLLAKDPVSSAARLCIRPNGLLNALWTQLAFAIDGHINLRSCVECRNWFTLEAGRGRSDKEYCSDACRMRAYRKRKEGNKRVRKRRRQHPA